LLASPRLALATMACSAPPLTAGASLDPVAQVIADVAADRLGIVAAADALEQHFKTLGLSYVMTINPRQVGFDPCNRDGAGGNAKEVLALASEIAHLGWSWPATAHAVCIEELPGSKHVEEFNRKFAEGTGLAAVEPDSIRFGSLSCGHTNWALRCISAGVPSTCPALSEDGRLSLAKLEVKDPDYATAVKTGLKWLVLRADVRTRYPKALNILQVFSRGGPANRKGLRRVFYFFRPPASRDSSGAELHSKRRDLAPESRLRRTLRATSSGRKARCRGSFVCTGWPRSTKNEARMPTGA
jgi:hypothetical protein